MKILNKTTTIALLALLSACSGKIGKQATAIREGNQQLSVRNKIFKQKADEDFVSGNVDSYLKTVFDAQNEGIAKGIAEREELLINALKEKTSKQELEQKLVEINKKIEREKTKLEVLIASTGVKSFYEFEMAAFFESGEYKVHKSKTPEVQRLFRPAIDSVLSFTQRFSNEKLSVYLVTYGYADAQGFATGTALYNDIKTRTGSEEPSRESLNQVLSKLRAEEVMEQVRVQIVHDSENKIANFMDTVFESIGFGKGEELPSDKVQYTDEDPRRRIVKFYWKVLPRE